MNSWKKFRETKFLSKNAIYSKLNMKSISYNDYEHVQQNRNTMEEKILGFCHDTYLKIDVFLLTDVFGTFENTCLNH